MLDILDVGAGPIPQGGTGLVPYPLESFVTAVLDCTQATPDGGVELVPARPGYISILLSSSWVIEQVKGTQVTPLTCRAGTNTAHDNFILPFNARPTNAEVNGATPPSLGTGAPAAAATLAKTPNATVIFEITAPASGTGGFALRARFVVGVRWAAVGS